MIRIFVGANEASYNKAFPAAKTSINIDERAIALSNFAKAKHITAIEYDNHTPETAKDPKCSTRLYRAFMVRTCVTPNKKVSCFNSKDDEDFLSKTAPHKAAALTIDAAILLRSNSVLANPTGSKISLRY